MDAQAEQLAQRVHAARAARLQAQRMRQLAAERAEKLENELKNAAESGLRAQIARTVEARGRLQAAGRRGPAVRYYSALAAFGLLLGVASLGLGWTPLQDAPLPGQSVSPAPVLAAVPGDRLQLTFSYSVSQPTAR